MCTVNKLNLVLQEFYKKAHALYGDALKMAILYGSYARGDNTDESDIDIMVILDIPQDMENESSERIDDIVVELNLEYDVVLSPLVESYEKYEKYKTINPLFRNVEREGVRIAA